MKKKLFLGALLLGAMTLNSCVDNVESDSVKAVRQAKAEQMQAKATLDKANAEAALINANVAKAAQEALAKYQEAQAEKERAEAALAQAQAELVKAQTESERAAAQQAAEAAAVALEQAKADLEKSKLDIQALAAQYETQLYQNQLAALQAKKAYEDAVKNANKQEIAELMEAYQQACDDLLIAQKALASLNVQLAQLEAGLVSPNVSAEYQINSLNQQNSNLQNQINAAQDYISTIRDTDYAKAEADLPVEQKKLEDLKATKTQKASVAASASATKTNAYTALSSSDYVKAAQKVARLGEISRYDDWNGAQGKLYVLSIEQAPYGAPAGASDKWCAVAETKIWDGTDWTVSDVDYIPLFSDIESEDKTLSYEESLTDYDGNNYPYSYSQIYSIYNSYYDLVSGGLDKFVKAAKEFVANGAQKDFDNATKNYNEWVKKVEDSQTNYDNLFGLQEKYDTAVKALNDAEADEDGALAKAVADTKKAFWDAAVKVNPNYTEANETIGSVVNACETALNDNKTYLTQALKSKNYYENALNGANEKIAEFEGYAKTLTSGAEANTKAIATYNAAADALAQAQIDKDAADNAVSLQQSTVNALDNIVHSYNPTSGYWNKSEEIKQKEQQIAGWEAEIEDNNIQIAQLEKQIESGKLTQQQQIENLKADIANQEAKVAVLESKVKAAKEELDAALGVTDETPAE